MVRYGLCGLAIVATVACSGSTGNGGSPTNPAPAQDSGGGLADGGSSPDDGGTPGTDSATNADSSSPTPGDSSAPTPPDSGTVGPPVDAGLVPGVPPSKNFDLSVWSLTLPIGSAGNPTIISSAQLVAGYTSMYFFTGSDGAMVFWAPVTGVTTSGSKYPRSELREDKNGGGYNWSLSAGTSTLTASVAIDTLPPSNKIVVGQIHGTGPTDLPLIELAYDAGQIVAEVIANPNVNTQVKTPVASGIGAGTVFDYSIQTTASSMLVVSVNGKVGYSQAIDASWSTQQFYFKAGDYVQDNTGTSTQGGQVSFYALSIAHGP